MTTAVRPSGGGCSGGVACLEDTRKETCARHSMPYSCAGSLITTSLRPSGRPRFLRQARFDWAEWRRQLTVCTVRDFEVR